MAKKYTYDELSISELILDDENPRFASSALVEGSNTKASQTAIIAHLLRHADIIGLAKRIEQVNELHGSELITCYKRDGKYVVLEGNRRICACRLLLDRSLIPEEYKKSFPFISNETKENIELIQSCVYPDRDSVQAYLSDRHISGVKKWSSLEKNNYYMNLFKKRWDINDVKNHTSDSESTIKNCIMKYQFFMDVFNALKKRYLDIEIEKLDYLPMVDRFMNVIVGDDDDVGLHLLFDDVLLKYVSIPSKLEKYEKILTLIGEAFLLRPEKKYCSEGELSKIISTEIKNISEQKALIIDDSRIPGLIALINEYRQDEPLAPGPDTSGTSDNGEGNDKGDDQDGGHEDGHEDGGQDGSGGSETNGGEDEYVPPVIYRPQRTKRKHLAFLSDEAKGWNINGDSDFEIKIRSLIYDLTKISIYEHPYACAMLYRSLLEVCTRFVYNKKSAAIKNPYNETSLVLNMSNLNNNIIFSGKSGKDIPKIKESIKTHLSSPDLIQTLNLYIHYSNPVDEQILLSSWNTMKFYISACLEQ